jgi:phage replication-related protein YjqB (UPF0714/DUF867 family)
MASDKYSCIEDLKANEIQKHYKIRTNIKPNRKKQILVFSPHGGGIEKGVSEIVDALALIGDYNSYLFEGRKKKDNKKDLHITSHRFNEKKLIEILGAHYTSLSIHGMNIKSKEVDIIIGGLNQEFGEILKKNLSIFNTCTDEKQLPECLGLFARHHDNVTNKCISKKGVQIEISKRLRSQFFEKLSPKEFRQRKTDLFDSFINSLNNSINEYLNP